MKRKNEKIRYAEHCIDHNIKIIRILSTILLAVFSIYFILSLSASDILPESMKAAYFSVYAVLILLSALYLGTIRLLRLKFASVVLRYVNLTVICLFSFTLAYLSVLDFMNTNEMTPFIVALIIIAIIYREKNLILYNILAGNALLLIFLLHFLSGNSLGIIRIIDIIVYTVISIAFAYLTNRSDRENFLLSLKLEENTRELEILSFRDSLTGVFNRRYLFFVLQNEKNRVMRNSSSFAVMMVDLDHFKKINDAHGHLAGDSVLFEFSAITTQECREEDIITRYGGEEFMIILIGATENTAFIAAERLRKKIACHKFSAVPEQITVSIGIAEFTGKEEIDDLIKKADDNLYRAKSEGRNTTRF